MQQTPRVATADGNAVKVFNPWNPKNRELTPSDTIPILKRYGWKGRFKNFNLFSQACCHKSYNDHPELWEEHNTGEELIIVERPENCLPLRKADNEELEFLGDRVLGLVVASYISRRYPKQGEGFLTRILSCVVNNKQLGKLAKAIGLSPWVILSRHMEEVCDGRNNLRVLGSMLEAWIGALYMQEEDISRGMQQCQDFIINMIEKHIDFVQIITEDTNYKDQLLRLFQSKFHSPPRYKEVAILGPLHDRIFTMGVVDPEDNIIATATARNKKVAEQEASCYALEILMSNKDYKSPIVKNTLSDSSTEERFVEENSVFEQKSPPSYKKKTSYKAKQNYTKKSSDDEPMLIKFT